MATYAELSPAKLRVFWDAGAPAIVPWGALEWHGDHLPLGLDGIVAEVFAQRLGSTIDGVVLPGVWLPITTLPHASSLSIRTETLRAVLDDVLSGLSAAGAARIALVTGHYAQGHLIELYEAALRAMEDFPGLLVFAATPLEPLGRPDFLDHAARYETSQLLALRPELVDLTGLPATTNPPEHAVLGEHPLAGSAAEGEELLDLGLRAWTDWLRTGTRESLEAYYKTAFDLLDPYVQKYFTGSWEEALAKWWATQPGPSTPTSQTPQPHDKSSAPPTS